MHFALAPYELVDDGGPVWRPRIPAAADGEWWGAIRFGAVGASPDTRVAIVCTDIRRDQPWLTYLGEEPDLVSTVVRQAIGSRLGLTLASTNLRAIIGELLTQHGRTDGTRWRNMPAKGGIVRVRMNGRMVWRSDGRHNEDDEFTRMQDGTLRWALPLRRGSITDTFDRADAVLSGSTSSDGLFVWEEYTATGDDWDIVSMAATPGNTGGVQAGIRAESDLGSNDLYSELVLTTFTPSAGDVCDISVIVRKDNTTTDTHNEFSARSITATEQHNLYHVEAGTRTQLGSTDTTDPADGALIRVEADGGDITGYRNYPTVSVGPTADTVSTLTGQYAGMRGRSSDGASTFAINDWEADVLNATATGHSLLLSDFRNRTVIT